MDYEKAYKNLVAKVKNAHLYAQTDSTKNVLEDILPELRESEDERIRKKCIELIKRVIPSGDSQSQESKEILDCIAYLEKQKEKKFDFELIKQAWYMEGYKDREFSKESKWIIKTGDGGPEYELNPKYGQPLAEMKKPTEKQDYSGLNDLERAIHRGFLVAGAENVPVTIIKETAQDCLAHMPAEWSEEDTLMLTAIIQTLERFGGRGTTGMQIDWLKSLRPSWKPSEALMEILKGYNHPVTRIVVRELIDKINEL